LSRMVFKVELTEENQVPGDYDLEVIRALPSGYQRSQNKPGIELGAAEVSFRIEKTPLNPTVALRYWGLGHGRDSRRYLG